MASSSKLLSFEELVMHNQKNDCWILISGKVYDVTPFLDDHPGGEDVILTSTEKDATNEFEDVGHSDSAREMMKKYYIGEIDSTGLSTKQSSSKSPRAAISQAKKLSGLETQLILFLLPLLILGLAIAYRHFTKKD